MRRRNREFEVPTLPEGYEPPSAALMPPRSAAAETVAAAMPDPEILARAAEIVRTRLVAHSRRGRFMIRLVAGALDRFAPIVEELSDAHDQRSVRPAPEPRRRH